MQPSPQRAGSAHSIKRIMMEFKEISEERNPYWTAWPLSQEEPHEWHFTIRGPSDSEFEGGMYHGRIVLPQNYPLGPPSVILLTPNGRFEVGKKVCLSASNYHPELWQPAWGLRSLLDALHAFFPTPGEGALHSLDWPPEIRKKIAKDSVNFKCSMCNKTNLEIVQENCLGATRERPMLPWTTGPPTPTASSKADGDDGVALSDKCPSVEAISEGTNVVVPSSSMSSSSASSSASSSDPTTSPLAAPSITAAVSPSALHSSSTAVTAGGAASPDSRAHNSSDEVTLPSLRGGDSSVSEAAVGSTSSLTSSVSSTSLAASFRAAASSTKPSVPQDASATFANGCRYRASAAPPQPVAADISKSAPVTTSDGPQSDSPEGPSTTTSNSAATGMTSDSSSTAAAAAAAHAQNTSATAALWKLFTSRIPHSKAEVLLLAADMLLLFLIVASVCLVLDVAKSPPKLHAAGAAASAKRT